MAHILVGRILSLNRETKCALLLAPLMLGACNTLPRDPEGTSSRIEKAASFSVGAMEPSLQYQPAVKLLVHELEERTKARAEWRPGSGEALLQQLDDGTLDIVIGRFQADSPWKNEVAFGPALAAPGNKQAPIELKAAMRNGENRWIIQVERASRTVSATAMQQ